MTGVPDTQKYQQNTLKRGLTVFIHQQEIPGCFGDKIEFFQPEVSGSAS